MPLPESIIAGATGHVSHHNTLHEIVNDLTRREFSAVGLGLAAAVAAADAAGGGQVWCGGEDVTHTLVATLTVPGVTLVGAGATITADLPSQAVLSLTGTRPGLNGVVVHNTDVTTGNIGVSIGASTTDVRIEGCRFPGSSRTQAIAAKSSGISGLLIQGNTFDGVNYGILTDAGVAGAGNDITRVRIIGNDFTNIYSDAIELNHPGAAGVGVASPYEGGKRFVVMGNTISVPVGLGSGSGSGFGIGLAGVNYASIVGNIIEAARTQGIHIEDESKHVSLAGNVVAGSGGHGIYIIDADFVSLVANEVYDCDDVGIYLDYDADDWATAAKLIGNTATGCGDSGIIAAGTGASLDQVIDANICIDNVGHGIELRGSGRSVTVANNICRGNTGYGLRLESTRNGLILGTNQLVGNTAGDFVLSNAGHPLILGARRGAFTAVVSGSATPFTDAFSLGTAATGRVAVLAYHTANSANWSSRVWDLEWDGTTLAYTQHGGSTGGTMGALSIQAASGMLQAKVAFATASAPVEFDVQFTGALTQGV